MVIIDLSSAKKYIVSFLEFLFFPPRCAYCADDCESGKVFCSECMQAVRPIVSYDVSITNTYKVKVFALCAYVDPVKKLIRSKRFSNRRASRLLGKLIVEYMLGLPQHIDVVIPVPLHWTRYGRRGYNQAEVMGRVIAQHFDVECIELLRRIRRTFFQAGLHQRQRIENLKGAFSYCESLAKKYEGKHIMIVDDVMTTGATISAAVKELRKLKPASITVVVAARVV